MNKVLLFENYLISVFLIIKKLMVKVRIITPKLIKFTFKSVLGILNDKKAKGKKALNIKINKTTTITSQPYSPIKLAI
jgi:hypothetical protein